MNLNEYLQSIRIQLTMQSKRADQIVIEIEQHIKDQAKQYLLNGITVEQAEQMACEEFGEPSKVAQRFNKTYRHPLHSFWSIVGAVLFVYTLVRFLVAVNLNTSRGFALTIGPGFYDSLSTIYVCITLAVIAFLMGRFIYHFLAPLTPSSKARQLLLLLATGVVAGYHLFLTIIQYIAGIIFFGGMGYYDGDSIVYIPYLHLQISRVVYYITVNLFYSGLTTVVLFVSLYLTFWWLQKRQQQTTLTSA